MPVPFIRIGSPCTAFEFPMALFRFFNVPVGPDPYFLLLSNDHCVLTWCRAVHARYCIVDHDSWDGASALARPTDRRVRSGPLHRRTLSRQPMPHIRGHHSLAIMTLHNKSDRLLRIKIVRLFFNDIELITWRDPLCMAYRDWSWTCMTPRTPSRRMRVTNSCHSPR